MKFTDLKWRRGIGGGRYAFIGDDYKIVELGIGIVLVERCIDKMPQYVISHYPDVQTAFNRMPHGE